MQPEQRKRPRAGVWCAIALLAFLAFTGSVVTLQEVHVALTHGWPGEPESDQSRLQINEATTNAAVFGLPYLGLLAITAGAFSFRNRQRGYTWPASIAPVAALLISIALPVLLF